MVFVIVVTFYLLHFAFVALASPPGEATLDRHRLGYKCGDTFLEQDFLERVLIRSPEKQEYHGHIYFSARAVYTVPIPNLVWGPPPYNNYIILDSSNNIIGVITPGMVDNKIDSIIINESQDRTPIFTSPPASRSYRKCEEMPQISSVSDPVGGFECKGTILKTRDAIKAAYSARRMHEKSKKVFLPSALSRHYPKSYSGKLKFHGHKPDYTLPVTVEGNFDRNGQMLIALDGNFNVIGATVNKPRGSTPCTELKYVKPKIIGYGQGVKEDLDRYQCYSGSVSVTRVLDFASNAWTAFREREISPIRTYPKIYKGDLFPLVMETLYYAPLTSISGKQIDVVMTRSCDIVGVIQELLTDKGFNRCQEKSRDDNTGYTYTRRTRL